MDQRSATVADQTGRAARVAERQRTGLVPQSAAAVQRDGAAVITRHGALSEPESAVAEAPGGAARLQACRRERFAGASPALRAEVKRITGVEVRKAAAAIAAGTGAVVAVFTTGTVVQVHRRARSLPAES